MANQPRPANNSAEAPHRVSGTSYRLPGAPYFIALAVGAVAVLAVRWTSPSPDRLLVEPSHARINAAPEGKTIAIPFRIVNNTDSDMPIARYSTNCGCAVLQPVPDLLQVGREYIVNLEANTSGKRGPVRYVAQLFKEDGDVAPVATLEATIEVAGGPSPK